MEEDDATVDKRFIKKNITVRPDRDSSYMDIPNMRDMAKNASIGDVAEMCLEAIKASKDPQAVAEKLLPELQKIKNMPKKKP
jgi:hypothetical protein